VAGSVRTLSQRRGCREFPEKRGVLENDQVLPCIFLASEEVIPAGFVNSIYLHLCEETLHL